MPIPGGPRPATSPRRTLAQVAARLGCAVPEGHEVVVGGVTLSSRTARAGDLYAALPGARTHGAAFVAPAVAAGAVAVLTDPAGRDLLAALPAGRASGGIGPGGGEPGGVGPGRGEPGGAGPGVPVLVVERPREVLGALAAWVYGDPGKDLRTYAVTGTNGKTTTTFLLDSALARLGRRTGLIGTIEIRVGAERVASTGTTPEAPDLHALLAVMVEHGVTEVSMEISSHALDQHRVDGLVVDVAGFTNLSRDHLDYHHTFEDYFAAKARLFTPEHARRVVVCVDDAWGRRLADLATVPVTTVSARPPRTDRSGPDGPVAGGPAADGPADEGRAADWTVVARRPAAGGRTTIDVECPAGRLTLTCPLPGDFNIANTLVALAMLTVGGVPAERAARALEAAEAVPGRMEPVGGPGRPGEPLAIVDYAHTPDAVGAALAAVDGRGRPLVVVLGAGGDRDPDKRPQMGAVAARAADVVVVTDDNPRSEDPAAIRAAVLAGATAEARRSGAVVLEVGDRRRAIAEGIVRAWHGGVVLVAGKGHEQGQDVAGTVRPFDDRQVVAEALRAVEVPAPPSGPAAVSGPATVAGPAAAEQAKESSR